MDLKMYDNNIETDKLTNFEVSFLQAVVDEGERQFNDTYEEDDNLRDFVDRHYFTITALDDGAVDICLEMAREIEKVFNVKNEWKDFAGDILCDLMFGTDYYHEYIEDLNPAQKKCMEKHSGFYSPYISISIYDDVRVFYE